MNLRTVWLWGDLVWRKDILNSGNGVKLLLIYQRISDITGSEPAHCQKIENIVVNHSSIRNIDFITKQLQSELQQRGGRFDSYSNGSKLIKLNLIVTINASDRSTAKYYNRKIEFQGDNILRLCMIYQVRIRRKLNIHSIRKILKASLIVFTFEIFVISLNKIS